MQNECLNCEHDCQAIQNECMKKLLQVAVTLLIHLVVLPNLIASWTMNAHPNQVVHSKYSSRVAGRDEEERTQVAPGWCSSVTVLPGNCGVPLWSVLPVRRPKETEGKKN